MSRRLALVTQADIDRALRAAGDGRAVEIHPSSGIIRIVPLAAVPTLPASEPAPVPGGFVPSIPMPLDDGRPVPL